MMSNQRVAVVAGSSSGNGYETSLTLARKGFVTYATMRSLTKGENIKSVAEKEKLPLKTVQLDVAEDGRVAFFTTDGGTAFPPAWGAGPAKVMKAEFTTKSILNH